MSTSHAEVVANTTKGNIAWAFLKGSAKVSGTNVVDGVQIPRFNDIPHTFN